MNMYSLSFPLIGKSDMYNFCLHSLNTFWILLKKIVPAKSCEKVVAMTNQADPHV